MRKLGSLPQIYAVWLPELIRNILKRLETKSVPLVPLTSPGLIFSVWKARDANCMKSILYTRDRDAHYNQRFTLNPCLGTPMMFCHDGMVVLDIQS